MPKIDHEKYLDIVEVFSSIQGEGPYIGYRQVFLRLAGCNLSCDYCDTVGSHKIPSYALVETEVGKREFKKIKNPVSVYELSQYVNFLLEKPHHSISITGGEPLLQPAISSLIPLLRGSVFLETNGTLPDKLTVVLPEIDFISMDIKLPSVTGRSFWSEHREFLRLANTRTAIVKVIIGESTSLEEFFEAVRIVVEVDSAIPFILQPVTTATGQPGVTLDKILAFYEQAHNQLQDVRLIPQMHKYLGIL